ncbi:MAG: hypothetical protein A3G34_14505 [Candidatus Lindowbacteria bacterium RIFCSPLOWO2_12_FULL_62_27]|nr:MAG: hypothetical protein A3I06_15915 [Candidatus Lindowbacteria bacterium RIFCSPLOWO2_02_FULL_62_12]OGH63075.1 MAG: hypothetical protein A3G34_14505 [Candidatus Lindowbacteria bacterium RIFCSPLOWO2_12_FULL_62_27]
MDKQKDGISRRTFLKSGAAAIGMAAAGAGRVSAEAGEAPEALGPGPVPCALSVNGREVRIEIEPRVTLLRALRHYSDYTGPKEICDRGACGGCTVLLDGKPVASCMMLALDAQGRPITTVEGLARDGKLHPVQEAFKTCDAYQCGYCTPGMLLSTVALLKENPAPSLDEIKRGLEGNLCRCAAYNHIFDAVQMAAKKMSASPAK